MVSNDVFYRTFLTIVTSARLNYELPDDGQQTMLPHHCMVSNDVFYRTFLTIVTSDRLSYELPDDGQETETCRSILV
jgi:hypothetical protein